MHLGQNKLHFFFFFVNEPHEQWKGTHFQVKNKQDAENTGVFQLSKGTPSLVWFHLNYIFLVYFILFIIKLFPIY